MKYNYRLIRESTKEVLFDTSVMPKYIPCSRDTVEAHAKSVMETLGIKWDCTIEIIPIKEERLDVNQLLNNVLR